MEGECRRVGSQQGWPLPKQWMGIWKCSTSTWQLGSVSRKHNFSYAGNPRGCTKVLHAPRGHLGNACMWDIQAFPSPPLGPDCPLSRWGAPLTPPPSPSSGAAAEKASLPRSRGAGRAGSAAAAPASDRLPPLCLRKIHLAMADLLHAGAGGRGERLGRQGGTPEALLELPSPPTRTPDPAFC